METKRTFIILNIRTRHLKCLEHIMRKGGLEILLFIGTDWEQKEQRKITHYIPDGLEKIGGRTEFRIGIIKKDRIYLESQGVTGNWTWRIKKEGLEFKFRYKPEFHILISKTTKTCPLVRLAQRNFSRFFILHCAT